MARLPSLLIAAALVLGPQGCKAPESSPLDLVRGGPGDFDTALLGNRSFDEKALLRELRPGLLEYARTSGRKYAIDDAAYALELHLESLGFREAAVSYEIVEREGERPLIVFLIEEGVRTALGEVEFEGQRAEGFDAEELRDLVAPPEGGIFAERSRWYSQARIEAARGRIEALYYDRGFLDAAVERIDTEFSEDGTRAGVRYRIREGPRYTLGEVAIEGLPAEWERRTQRSIRASIGQPWLPRLGYEIRARVEEAAAAGGHPDVRTELEISVGEPIQEERGERREVRMRVQVVLGEAVRIRRVEVVGEPRTSESFLLSRLELREGDLFDRAKLRASFRNLYETGIFDRVRLDLVGEGPERDLVLSVEEGSTLEVYVEPGYGSYERLRIQAGITERNLFGTGRRLGADISAAVRAQNARLRFTEPNLFGPRTDIDLEGFAGRREEPSFTREEVGGAAQIRHRFTRQVNSTLRYERNISRAVDIAFDDPSALNDEENLNLGLLSLTPAYDSRNAPFLPTRGTLGRFTVEFSDPALGSELDYVRLLGTFVQYLALRDESVLALSLRSGVLLDTGASEAFPVQVRFFNGGENTVRSYRESGLGPKDSTGQPVGGEVYNVFSTEYRRGLVGHLQGAVFVDAGNVLTSASDYGSFADLGWAVGVGLRYVLPIGPVRLDLGLNPDPGEGESSYVLHFSLGTAY